MSLPFNTASRRSALSLLALSTLALSAPSFAQDVEELESPPRTTLTPMVVTASGFEQKIPDAPASISVITREELKTRPYTGLVDALRDIEGIDVGLESTDKNGEASISMRGLGSEYTLVLIDGRRQSNVGSIYPNNFGGGQFSYVPPLEAVDRIEVIRGPMSTRYGSDAIGGVINIITRPVTDRWLGSVATGLTLQEDSAFGHQRTQDVYVSGPLIKDRLGLVLRGSYYDTDASSPEYPALPLPDGGVFETTTGFGGGGKTVASVKWNGGTTLNYRITDNQDLSLDYNVARQTFDNRQGQTGTLDGIDSLWRSANAVIPDPDNPGETLTRRVVQPRVGYTPEQRYNREEWSLRHQGRWSFGNSDIAVTQSSSDNLGRSLPLSVGERAELQGLYNEVCVRRGQDPFCNNGTITNSDLTDDELARLNAFLPRALRTLKVDNFIVDAALDMRIGNHQITLGGQYLDAEMEDGTFGLFTENATPGVTQPHKQTAIFIEDNWALWGGLSLSTGVRIDDHNIFGNQVSPRGYLVWSSGDRLTIKGGVSTGYKAPRPDQLFPGITGFGGQGVSPFVGTPDLQPETSVNTELAVYFEDPTAGYSVNATVFLTRFKDKIATGDRVANCEIAAAGQTCVDIGPGWAALGFRDFSQSTNIDRAETQGMELAGRYEITPTLQVKGNYTLTDSESKSGATAGQPISGNPAKHMINANLSWQVLEKLNTFIGAELRSDRYRDTNEDTGVESYYKDYSLFHLGAAFKASETLTVNARINNLLDEDFISQSCTLAETQDTYNCLDDYLIKDRARNLWVGATMHF